MAYLGQVTNGQLDMPVARELDLQVEILLDQVQLFFVFLGQGDLGVGTDELVDEG